MNKDFLGLCAAVLVCSGIAAQIGQNDSTRLQQLSEVVVSDSRFELKRENSGKTVIRIDSDDMMRNQGRSVAEIINSESGIEIAGSRGGDGTVYGNFVRGGRGRQMLVLIDGVRVADPSSFSSGYDLRLLSTANVASIEIIKGASSTLYGTNAATAVINITTKAASTKKIAGNFQSSVATDQTSEDQNYNVSRFANSAQVSGTLQRFSYYVGFSNQYSDGLSALVTPDRERDDFSRFGTHVRLGYHFNDNFKLRITGNQTKLRTEYDETSGVMDADYETASKQDRLGLNGEYSYKNGSLQFNTAYSGYNGETYSNFPNSFQGKNVVADVYNKYSFKNKWYTVLGLNYIRDQAELTMDEKFTIVDPYINVVYVSDFGLNLNTGVRLNNHSEYGST
ncbi:MAG TPA: TonB-dependent receptor plug domain-containing protein, partial [Pricia sp.]|nr:TonB-dependent receptor plug domain-containing protein [Pricia sp.]